MYRNVQKEHTNGEKLTQNRQKQTGTEMDRNGPNRTETAKARQV